MCDFKNGDQVNVTTFRRGDCVIWSGNAYKISKRVSDLVYEIRTLAGGFVGYRHVSSLRRAGGDCHA